VTEGAGDLVLTEKVQPAAEPVVREIQGLRERTRGRLVFALVGILGALVVAFPVCAAFVPDTRWDRVEAQLTGIITGVVGLVGIAVGWYFGSGSNR
jgi:drug/metabolite transporter (DMT)-like permease